MKPFPFLGIFIGLATLIIGVPVNEHSDTDLDLIARDGAAAGDICSTPNLTMCLPNESNKVFKCSADHQWEVHRECGAWCCRFGLHGYPDCYEQCDSIEPPTGPVETSKHDNSVPVTDVLTYNEIFSAPSCSADKDCRTRKCCPTRVGYKCLPHCPRHIDLNLPVRGELDAQPDEPKSDQEANDFDLTLGQDNATAARWDECHSNSECKEYHKICCRHITGNRCEARCGRSEAFTHKALAHRAEHPSEPVNEPNSKVVASLEPGKVIKTDIRQDESEAKRSQPSGLVWQPQGAQINGECAPGCYSCDIGFRAIGVCDSTGHYILSQYCGPRHGSCTFGLIDCTAFCV